MEIYCKKNSIRHQTSCANTTNRMNWVNERTDNYLVRASLFDMNVTREYWGEAVRPTAYLINRTPSQVINFETPLKKLQELVATPTTPNLEPCVFGCTSCVMILKKKRCTPLKMLFFMRTFLFSNMSTLFRGRKHLMLKKKSLMNTPRSHTTN